MISARPEVQIHPQADRLLERVPQVHDATEPPMPGDPVRKQNHELLLLRFVRLPGLSFEVKAGQR
jgi:hypothetical protein